MKVILIDKALKGNKPAQYAMKCILEKEFGFTVDTCSHISELGIQNLGNYQLAIAHPDIESNDPYIIDAEVKKRTDFSVIINSNAIGIPSEDKGYRKKVLLKESKQVVYTSGNLQDVIKLLKKGW
jgi:hypothetical protein